MTGLMLLAVHVRAQRPAPACTLASDTLRPIRLRDGSYGMIFPQEVSLRGDSLLLLGIGATMDAKGNPIQLKGDDSSLVGFLLTDDRRVATPIAAPHGMPTARYFRSRLTARGWESVFFVPDHDTIPGLRSFDTGTLWYAELVNARWTGLQRVGRIHDITVMRPNSSGLVARDGALHFALFHGEPFTPGGVQVWSRTRAGKWSVDSLPLKWGPLSLTTPSTDAAQQPPRFFPVVGIWEGGEMYPGSLLAVSPSKTMTWSVVRRSRGQSMNSPIELAVGDTLHVSWWEFDELGKPSIWYQALDPKRENAAEGRRQVAHGINSFMFFAVPEGGRTRLVWAYRLPTTVDSAEVAVVANGEPVIVGQVAFPFGFMTNGVASGDRSFILATTPRPSQGGEPSASRTLEVRVTCRGGI